MKNEQDADQLSASNDELKMGSRCTKKKGVETSLGRRSFIQATGATVAGLSLGSNGANAMPALAGPFDENEYTKTIPADKKLDPAWVKSLYERGEKQRYSDPSALERIGMPVGGLFAGTVYLSGDGRLWLWDIFNQDQEGLRPASIRENDVGKGIRARDGLNFVSPLNATQPFDIGFTLSIDKQNRQLDSTGFRDTTFTGKYPIGEIEFRDPDCPISGKLQAYSPFVPLNADDSSLPATVMSYKFTNRSDKDIEFSVSGRMQNPICLQSARGVSGRRVNSHLSTELMNGIQFSIEEGEFSQKSDREDILISDFESDSYGKWKTTGDAFGTAPVAKTKVAAYQGDLGAHGSKSVNSHASAIGESTGIKDSQIGTLTSPEFTLERKYISFLVGGGSHKGDTCINLLIDGKVIESVTGKNQNRMTPGFFTVASHEGKTATIEILDKHKGAWGNIGVDNIVQTDSEPVSSAKLDSQRDYGTMTLALIGDLESSQVQTKIGKADQKQSKSRSMDADLVGAVSKTLKLAAGESQEITFVVAWHFPNFHARGVGALVGHRYAKRHASATEVATYLAENFQRLSSQTADWVDTWYDSTLPYWLLDRTMANTSILATTTCYRFADGRFWAWEGIGCCPGTCTHVWHYAQAVGRLFPEIERDTRERVDFGIGFLTDGGIGHRADLNGGSHSAHDGQCGRILGAYREHQMSTDDGFLKTNWPKIKLAIQYLIKQDSNADGMIEGSQPNTLDAAWFGKISFLASLYLAALRAGELMAIEMGDKEFSKTCSEIRTRGATSILDTYNGEYFAQIEDPAHQDEIGVGPGCYIDQVFGQTWAHWVGLGNLFDREKQLSALRAIWKYNFVPDVGPFREKFKQGRWYAMAGEAGTIMCSWPKGGQNPNFAKHWQYGYFNECMSGFEWQAAAHMIWEGIDQADLLQNGLAMSRSIHERYDAGLRNPYNEIECSDHYSRAMASYGVFQAVCGFNYHGPKGEIEFAPRLSPENFKSAFVTAEGWGTFTQTRESSRQTQQMNMKSGSLKLTQFQFQLVENQRANRISFTIGGRTIDSKLTQMGTTVIVSLVEPIELRTRESLKIVIAY